ncbi:MAG TPA: hypothetical protein VKV40_14390 [Ktedonobacteraceae bacterium]|nr:hypothetical protein [Ktedonobacteraceae bacterium]
MSPLAIALSCIGGYLVAAGVIILGLLKAAARKTPSPLADRDSSADPDEH